MGTYRNASGSEPRVLVGAGSTVLADVVTAVTVWELGGRVTAALGNETTAGEHFRRYPAGIGEPAALLRARAMGSRV